MTVNNIAVESVRNAVKYAQVELMIKVITEVLKLDKATLTDVLKVLERIATEVSEE